MQTQIRTRSTFSFLTSSKEMLAMIDRRHNSAFLGSQARKSSAVSLLPHHEMCHKECSQPLGLPVGRDTRKRESESKRKYE